MALDPVDRIVTTPLHVGLFAHIADEADELGAVYRDFLELFTVAERVGVEYAWVRQFHLRNPGNRNRGGLPSPFVFLSHLAARTSRIRLGTAAVTLPLERPLRVAEDAAVLDLLSDGRVELGLANGGFPALAGALGASYVEDQSDRRAAYLAAVDAVADALRGRPLNEQGDLLAPASPELAGRIWQATLTERSAFEAGARGEGVLLGTTQVVPAEVSAAAYHRGLAEGATARVGVSTWIFPAADRATALRLAERGIRRKWEWAKGFLAPSTTLEEIAATLNIHYGSAGQIADSIARHPAFRYTTHLQLQVDGLYDSLAQREDAVALFVTEVAPALGWAPATATV
ncbi:MAG: LLM class flavin-dependent oxidoreductase [Microbacterium sp.]|uniref:LLM class flavin-dependent oxidoreductase n=1 Tax=Microbacterium sp. TaxID=51671 RepID=UPI0039E499AD